MDNISRRILEFNNNRLSSIVPLKYEAMAENLFRFYRGTNHIFYEDLAAADDFPMSPNAWICGDLHLENFGSYRSDNRLVYFDLNDFDEALLAPCNYELARLLTSIFIAFESLQIDHKRALKMAELFTAKYAAHLSLGKPTYIERQTAHGIVCDFLNSAGKRKQQTILDKRTISKKHKLEILLDDPRHIELTRKQREDLFDHITDWLKNDGKSPYNYKPVDAVFRLAGTGSLGLNRYAILLKSLNGEGEKYILIDMKQSTPPAIQSIPGIAQPGWDSDADRITTIQTRMQNRPPALLSTTMFEGNSYVIQEMQPVKDSINFKLIKKDYRAMCRVIEDMAMLTASAQLRSTGQQGSCSTDDLILFGKDLAWRETLLNYAIKYSSQVKNNYLLYLQDYKKKVFKEAKKQNMPVLT